MGTSDRRKSERPRHGYVVMMQDHWIMDGIEIFTTDAEREKATAEFNRQAAYNNRNYQGSWRVWVRYGKPNLRGYLKAVGIH